MKTLALAAPAKINLHLRVLAREESGFHQLETLFTMLDLADRVELTLAGRSGGVVLQEDGVPPCPPEQNLAVRAATAFLERTGVREGVRIRLQKVIPPGGGLGGGSSDAGAVLRLLNRLFGEPMTRPELAELGGELGSDVPFFLSPSPLAFAWGRGNRILPLRPLPEAPVLLALPPFPVSTPEAFQALALDRQGRPGPGATLLERGFPGGWDGVADRAVNDLERPVFLRHRSLGAILEGLGRTRPRLALLSGSGSSVFAVYRSQEAAQSARGEVQRELPEVRFALCRTLTRVPGIQEAGG